MVWFCIGVLYLSSCSHKEVQGERIEKGGKRRGEKRKEIGEKEEGRGRENEPKTSAHTDKRVATESVDSKEMSILLGR